MTTGLSGDTRHVALLGLGEAGTALATGLCQSGGWRDSGDGRTVIAIDVACHDGERGERMRSFALANGISVTDTYTDSLQGSDLVISVVTGDDAVDAAAMAKPWLNPGVTYADFNSITGPHTRRVADALIDVPVNFVDVGVMGSFKASGHRVPLLVSGPGTSDLLAFCDAAGMPAKRLDHTASDGIGDASSVKILRSILMKGIEALAVECLVAASRQGLVEQLLDNVSDVDSLGFARFVEVLAVTHPTHARRRMQEVEKAIDNLHETGVDVLMSEATRRSHERTVNAGFRHEDVVDLDLDATLKLLDKRLFS